SADTRRSLHRHLPSCIFSLFRAPSPPVLYALSLHDALPICARCGRRLWGCRPSASEEAVLETASWVRGFWRSADPVGSPTPNGPASRWRSQHITARPELGPHGRAQLGTEREGYHRVGTPGGGRGVDHEQSSTTLGAG